MFTILGRARAVLHYTWHCTVEQFTMLFLLLSSSTHTVTHKLLVDMYLHVWYYDLAHRRRNQWGSSLPKNCRGVSHFINKN